MSVWAKAWAYEQRCGKTDEDGGYKGNPGAKSVLGAVAEFADERGIAWPAQDTLAIMCDMTDRSVRTHLAYLEEELGLIERKERRSKNGERTSDLIRLLAPPHRLRPGPSNTRPPKGKPQPEKFSSSDDLPENNVGPTGKVFQGTVKEPLDTYNNSAREDQNVTALGDVTSKCLLILSRVKGFPREHANNAIYLERLREEYPNVDAVETCRQYEIWHMDNPGKTKNYRSRLRAFFKNAHGKAPTTPSTPSAQPGSLTTATPAAGVHALKTYDNDGRTDLRQFAHLAERWDFSSDEEPPFKVYAKLGSVDEERDRYLKRIRSVVRRAIRAANAEEAS